MSRIIIKDLSAHTTEDDIKKKFSTKGTITECSLRYTPDGVFRRFAFIGFKENSEAQEAVREFNNTYINANKIKVAIAGDLTRNAKKGTVWSKNAKAKNSNASKSSKGKIQATQWAVKVTGLPVGIKKNQIEEFFAPIKCHADMPDNKAATKLVTYFESEKELQEAMRRNKTFIGAKKIFLHKHTVPPGTFVQATQNDDQPEEREEKVENKGEEKELILETGRLFVRNLAYCCTEEELTKLFSVYGHMTVQLQVDKFRGEQKGFALVNYVMPENALAAYESLDGTIFQGRMLHIVGGKPNKEETTDIENLPFNKKKEILKKNAAAKSKCWNTLFVNEDALAEVIAGEMGISKRDLYISKGNESVAAKLAVKHTDMINKMRQFLIDNGVAIDSFSQNSGLRSKSVMIAKDLPAGTTEKDLREIFKEHIKFVDKIIIPPFGLTAIIKFSNEIMADKAFKDLIFIKIKHLPLYLEWAPSDILSGKVKNSKVNEEKTDESQGESSVAAEVEKHFDVDLSLPRRFVFVKNFPSNVEEEVKEYFEKCGRVVSIKFIKRKTEDTDDEACSGFVEYGLPDFAEECIRKLDGAKFKDQKLDLKISDRSGTAAPESQLKKKIKKSEGDEEEEEDEDASNHIIIKNVPFEANKKDLKQLFSNYEGAYSIRLPLKAGPNANSHRGFAFVTFNTKLAALNAFNQLRHSTVLYGRRLVLEWSKASQMSGDVSHLRKRTAEKYNPGPASKKSRVDLVNSLQTGEN